MKPHSNVSQTEENADTPSITLGIFGALYRGFALAILWRWFAVPLGLPEIGVAHGIGLSSLGGLISGQSIAGDWIAYKVAEQRGWRREIAVVSALVVQTLALIVGFICKLFM